MHPVAIIRTAASVIPQPSPPVTSMLKSPGRQMPSNVASVTRSAELPATRIDDVRTPRSINHLIQENMDNSPLNGLMYG